MPDNFFDFADTFTSPEWVWFFKGFGLGFLMGGTAFIFRLVRQAGRQNPEM